MEIDERLQDFEFHEQWNLTKKVAKPFAILIKQIDQHIENETHKTFKEEGLLFKSYLYMSDFKGNVNKDKTKAIECLKEVFDLLNTWEPSPEKDGFLLVAYTLEAWIDMEKIEPRLKDLKELTSKYRPEKDYLKHFEAAIHFIKGYSLSRLGAHRYAESIFEFQEANKKDPENYEYLFSLALMTRRLYGCSNEVGKELEKMLRGVLEKNNDYLYAKVELADVVNSNGNTSGAIKLLEEITTALKNMEKLTPENMKIVGHVMKIYLKMDKYEEKAEETYKMAIDSGQELHSFVIHQRAKLAKKREQWEDYKQFLKNALDKNPFNLYVELEYNKQILFSEEDISEVKRVYDELVLAHGYDDIAFVRIMCDFGTMLEEKKDEKAYDRYETAMERAFKQCLYNADEEARRIWFYNEVNPSVEICVRNLRDHWKDGKENPDIIYKLVKLEYKLGNLHLTSSYCKHALQMDLGEKLKTDITCIHAEVKIALSVDVASLKEVDNLLDSIKHPPDSLKGKLAFRKGLLLERENFWSAIYEYLNAAKYGHVDAIKRILTGLQMNDKNRSEFFKVCASIDSVIQTKHVGPHDARESMQNMLKSVLKSATFGDLKRLREQQFQMEKAVLAKNNPEDNAANVIQISRNLLNYSMHNLKKRYGISKDKNRGLDFYCIPKNPNKNETEEKIKKYLEKDNWKSIDEELITFLADIQPCTNPRANNWIMALMKFNNPDKHQEKNKEYGQYQVYSEEEGAQPGSYQLKEYHSVDLARTACDNIPYILDNLNGFTLIF